MIVRHYVMLARSGEGDALHAALLALAANIRRIEGCGGIDLLRDLAEAERFVFIERWAGIDAHAAGSGQVDKGLFGPVMAVLAAPPEARSFDCLALD